MNVCLYCNHDFQNKVAYQKHKKRATACISWQAFDVLMTTKDKEILDLKNELIIQKDMIRDIMSQLLIKEEQQFSWNEVTIVGPFLSTNVKKNIRNMVKDIKETSDIKSCLKTAYPNLIITKINIRKNNIEIILEDPDTSECKICYDKKAQKKSKCNKCKTCYICEECEYSQMKKYNRCAFCNTTY